jgi:hypothetical protein
MPDTPDAGEFGPPDRTPVGPGPTHVDEGEGPDVDSAAGIAAVWRPLPE